MENNNTFYLIDVVKLKERIENPDYTLYNGEMRADWIEQCIATAPVVKLQQMQNPREWHVSSDAETYIGDECTCGRCNSKKVKYKATFQFKEILYCERCNQWINLATAKLVDINENDSENPQDNVSLNTVFDANGEISESKVNLLVDLYMENAKAGKEAGKSDPFWFRSEDAFLTAMIYYVLENDNIPKEEKTFETVLQKVQMETADYKTLSPLRKEMYDWFVEIGLMTYSETDENGNQIKNEVERYKNTYDEEAITKNRTKLYYDKFQIAPQKTVDIILTTTATDLQIFLQKN